MLICGAAVLANFKAMLELGGTQKENAPQTTKSRKSKKIYCIKI